MNIWAHRGCSLNYPENTLTSFKKACEIKGLTGIELDVQYTSDGRIVVIHDETVDRTTDGHGFVRDYTLAELKKLNIKSVNNEKEHIPTLSEVLDLIMPNLKAGMKLNIELKTSIYPYIGIEEETVNMIKERRLTDAIVWSSFSALSLPIIRRMLPDADIGILSERASDCMRIHMAGVGSNAIHPYGNAIDLDLTKYPQMPVRAWFLGHLYPSAPTGTKFNFSKYEKLGVTDVFLNEPEIYLKER